MALTLLPRLLPIAAGLPQLDARDPHAALLEELDSVIAAAESAVAASEAFDFAEFEAGRKPMPIVGLVDVHICSAIPLLENKTAHCKLSESVDEMGCTLDTIQASKGHEAVLLHNLFGVMLLTQGKHADDDVMRLKAFRLMSKDYEDDDESWLSNFMNQKSGAFGQTAMKIAGGIFGCLADIAKTAASAFERDDEDSGTTRRVAVPVLPATLEEFEKGMLERDDRRPEAQTAGCMMLLSTIAQAIVGAMGWNSYDDWRIKAESELISTYLQELNLILARTSTTKTTETTVKQVLCTLTLFKTYWQYRKETTEEELVVDGYRFKPTLGLTRVVQSQTQSFAKEYNVNPKSGTDMAIMVDDMLAQLAQVQANLRQALQALVVRATMPPPTEAQKAHYDEMKKHMDEMEAKNVEAARQMAKQQDEKLRQERRKLLLDAFQDSGSEYTNLFTTDASGLLSDQAKALAVKKRGACALLSQGLESILDAAGGDLKTKDQEQLDTWWQEVQVMACARSASDNYSSCQFDGKAKLRALSMGRQGTSQKQLASGAQKVLKLRWASSSYFFSTPSPATKAIKAAWKEVYDHRCVPLIKYLDKMRHAK